MDQMLSLEKLANANIKNRAEYTQLFTELNRLEKEKQNEIRMFNHEMQRFKARYSKCNFGSDSAEVQASNVKMYDTHNPGFCFKRNGEHRGQQIVENNSTGDFEHLQFLVFTDGEVDVEKILCLHLLSSHETEHLTPPRRPRNSTTFTKKDSPLEQLIERSKDSNSKEAILKAILPTYVLSLNKETNKRTLFDERLSACLLVNEKILQLIQTVLSALEHSNPEKVQLLVNLATDPSSLKKIFRKQHIQDFVMSLKKHSIVKSCSSFILTQPAKFNVQHIEIRTPSGALEDLVRFIRENVLQFPKRENWEMPDAESKEICVIEQTPVATNVPTKFIEKQIVKKELSKESTHESSASSRFRRKNINFIRRNIELIATYKRNDDNENFSSKRRKSGSNFRRNENFENQRKHSFDSQGGNSNSKRESNVRVYLKQTKCPACMEKWKIPLPEPKVPKFPMKTTTSGESSVHSFSNNKILKTDSQRRLQNLIEQEEFRLQSYDRKYSNTSTISSYSRRKSTESSAPLDFVSLDVLDLEKIRYEIRTKETKKKLEKFLSTQ